ncbi:hypothetical protein H1R20_g5985, partial [Candolleomyces eurysporus]
MLFANFNQDFSCISIGTKKGYSITNCDPFGRVYTMNDGARGIVEMLFCTSLIALVGAADHPHSSPRKLQIVNTKRQSMICELLFPSSILSVKMNRKTLVIVLETEIYIYDISNMRLLHVIETTPNPEATCALSPSVESSYLAYPSPVPSPALPTASGASGAAGGSSTPTPPPTGSAHQTGDVLLFSTRSLTVSNVIQAHKSPISCLSLNSTGTLLATSSEKGTIIRVWSVPGAEKLYQFRRGTRECKIYSMNFNVVGSLLGVSSSHGTVHVFKLGSSSSSGSSSSVKAITGGAASGGAGNASPRSQAESLESSTLEGGYEAFVEGKKRGGGVGASLTRKSLSLTKTLTHSMGSYLPNSITEMWEPQRDFASFSLPTGGGGVGGKSGGGSGNVRTVVGLSGTMPHIMVISSEGYFYLYSIDLEKGGECSLLKQYSLLDSVDVEPSSEPTGPVDRK